MNIGNSYYWDKLYKQAIPNFQKAIEIRIALSGEENENVEKENENVEEENNFSEKE